MVKKSIKVLFVVLFLVMGTTSIVYGGATQIYWVGSNGFTNIGREIAGYVYYVGLALAVGMLMITGIKFIASAPEGKADAKKRIVPWAIGVVLLFSIKVFIDVFVNLGQQLNWT